MHMQGEPRTMQDEPRYGDVVAEVRDFLRERAQACVARGIATIAWSIDPGIGFGKRLEHNLALLAGLPALTALGWPVLVGVSRKSMFGALLGRAVDERLAGGVAAGDRSGPGWREHRARARRRGDGRRGESCGRVARRGLSQERMIGGDESWRENTSERTACAAASANIR